MYESLVHKKANFCITEIWSFIEAHFLFTFSKMKENSNDYLIPNLARSKMYKISLYISICVTAGAHKGFLEYEKKKEVDKLVLMLEVTTVEDPLLSQNAATDAPFCTKEMEINPCSFPTISLT